MLVSKSELALLKAGAIKKSHAWSPRLDMVCLCLVLEMCKEAADWSWSSSWPLSTPCPPHPRPPSSKPQRSHLYPSPLLAISHAHTTSPSKAGLSDEAKLYYFYFPLESKARPHRYGHHYNRACYLVSMSLKLSTFLTLPDSLTSITNIFFSLMPLCYGLGVFVTSQMHVMNSGIQGDCI